MTFAAIRPRPCWRCSTPNKTARSADHYLELPFDLSQVLFLTTGQLCRGDSPRRCWTVWSSSASPATRSRRSCALPGAIWCPSSLRKTASGAGRCACRTGRLRAIIGGYTREAGVRQLERTIAKVPAQGGAAAAGGGRGGGQGADRAAGRFAGDAGAGAFPARRGGEKARGRPGARPGVQRPTAARRSRWETTVMPGTGGLLLTGQLGDVMKESARAAMSYVRARAVEFGLRRTFTKRWTCISMCLRARCPRTGRPQG